MKKAIDIKIKKNSISKRKGSESNKLVSSAGSITLLKIIATKAYKQNPLEDVYAQGN